MILLPLNTKRYGAAGRGGRLGSVQETSLLKEPPLGIHSSCSLVDIQRNQEHRSISAEGQNPGTECEPQVIAGLKWM